MRLAICDDNSEFLNQTRQAIALWAAQPCDLTVELFEDGDALINAHTLSPFDIILLDVVMPLLNGIDTAREIRQCDRSVKIVFLTSSPEFALDSYSVKANDYLLKPLNPQKLYRCLEELSEEIRAKARSITVKSVGALHRVEISSIEYIEAQNKHVLFALTGGQTIESIEPLYTYEDKLLLSDGFFKCNRSYIVNIHRIVTYSLKEITMHSGCRISISRNYQKEFEAAYFSLLFRKAGDH